MSNKSIRIYLTLTVTLITFVILVTSSDSAFYSTGEPREAVVAQSMIINSNLLDSVRYDDEIATKPPLTHWLMVFSASLIGQMDELAARLPSIFCATLIIGFWFYFLTPRVGRKTALFAILILFTSAEWLRHANLARVDMTLSINVLLALLLGFLWQEKGQKKFLWLSILPLSLAALAKGPVGIVLPSLVIFIFLILEKKISIRKTILLAMISFLAVLPLFYWYYLGSLSTNNQTIEVAILENVNRFLGTMGEKDSAHVHGLFYMPGALLSGLLPWSLFLPLLFVYRDQLRNCRSLYRNLQPIVRFSCIATLVFFLFFLIPDSKRGVYLLPIYPFITLILSQFISKVLSELKIAKKIAFGISVLFTAIYFLVLTGLLNDFSWIPLSSNNIDKINFYQSIYHDSINNDLLIYLALLLVITTLLIFLYKNFYRENFRYYFCAFIIIYVTGLKALLLAPYANFMSSKTFVFHEIQDHHPQTLALYSKRMYGVLFYSRMANPALRVKDWQENATSTFAWSDEDQNLINRQYVHLSDTPVEKTRRHLQYVISGS